MQRTIQIDGRPVGLGWRRDPPDIRDWSPHTPAINDRLAKIRLADPVRGDGGLPNPVDLRPWCSEVYDQGQLGSCTANAAASLVEYFEIKAFNTHFDASRLFIYKTTRDLLEWQGDTGAYLRTTMAALKYFGAPPERYWHYTDKQPGQGPAPDAAAEASDVTRPAHFDVEPSAFCYAMAAKFAAIEYYRLDPPGTPKPDLLARIKTQLAGKLPAMFGFTVYSSIREASKDGGKIPFPSPAEQQLGGHAVMALGYDDAMKIKNAPTPGALLIKNSWGTGWGDHGYGWLPYDYVLKGLAVDWWVLVKSQVELGKEFGLDLAAGGDR